MTKYSDSVPYNPCSVHPYTQSPSSWVTSYLYPDPWLGCTSVSPLYNISHPCNFLKVVSVRVCREDLTSTDVAFLGKKIQLFLLSFAVLHLVKFNDLFLQSKILLISASLISSSSAFSSSISRHTSFPKRNSRVIFSIPESFLLFFFLSPSYPI